MVVSLSHRIFLQYIRVPDAGVTAAVNIVLRSDVRQVHSVCSYSTRIFHGTAVRLYPTCSLKSTTYRIGFPIRQYAAAG